MKKLVLAFCLAVAAHAQRPAVIIGGCGSDPGLDCVVETFTPTGNANTTIGQLGWSILSGTTVASASSANGRRAGYQITTGVTTNSTASLELAGTTGAKQFPSLDIATNWDAYFRFTTPATINEWIAEIGFDAAAGSSQIPVIGSYLRYDAATGCDGTSHGNGSDASWMFVSRDSGGTAAQAGPAIAASTGYLLHLWNEGSPGHVKFNLKADGGSWLATDVDISTHISTGTPVVPVFKQATCNTTSKTLATQSFSWIQEVQ